MNNNLSYSEAKKQIKKVGYGRVTGDADTLVHCEGISDYLQFQCMTVKPKKIYLWAQKHNLTGPDLLKIHQWIMEEDNKWIFWDAIIDDKEIKI